MRIGLISDTHGLLRPEALKFLRGADYIIHAGDIGDPEILEHLKELAPVTAVRGNNDTAAWARKIPLRANLEMGGVVIHVVHEIADRRASSARIVVSGHSHKPMVEEREGVLYVNPGSAGPRRFTLPIAAGELRIKGASVRAKIKELL
jgi:putative phosphoesterase